MMYLALSTLFCIITQVSSFSTATPAAASSATDVAGTVAKDPLLIRAAKGERVERTPVWMMRQAGRHIKEYRELCKKYPTFRERSEIAEVAVEVSLQPWRNYQTDGCILFSDILTPLPGMGAEFKIDEKLGPIMTPMRNWDDIKTVCSIDKNILFCEAVFLNLKLFCLIKCCVYFFLCDITNI